LGAAGKGGSRSGKGKELQEEGKGEPLSVSSPLQLETIGNPMDGGVESRRVHLQSIWGETPLPQLFKGGRRVRIGLVKGERELMRLRPSKGEGKI